MRPPEVFETSRLVLRPPRIDDAGDIFNKYAQDPEVTRFMVWLPHEKVETTREFLERCVKCWEDGTAYPWVMELKSDGTLLGMVEIRLVGYKVDLGYAIAKEYWGKGYTTEAVKAMVQWALDQDEVYRVWAVCDLDNTASARVLEKAGMQQEGVLRRYSIHPLISSEPRDCYSYSIVK